MHETKKSDRILLFDGVCNLCNTAVQYVLEHDTQQRITFASLQSNFGEKIRAENNLDASSLKTVIYIQENKLLIKSDAFFALMNDLGGWHKILLAFRIVPRFLRDWVYDRIATNRYAVFGKRETCYMPTPELMRRFIQD